MMVFMVVVCVVVFALLVAVAAVRPQRSRLSGFELERRNANGDKQAAAVLSREALLLDILSLQRVLAALLLVSLVALLGATFGWVVGITLSVIVALEYGAVARGAFVQKRAQRLYEKYEEILLGFIAKHPRFFGLIRSGGQTSGLSKTLDSREELEHLVAQSGALLSHDEKKLIHHSMRFNDRMVNEVMTPRGVIDTIEKRELLGPLTLDELHKTGHSRFPVIDVDVDHVIGVLHIQDLFTLDAKRSVTAEKAMEPRVFYIREDQSLTRALAAFLRTRHHLFVVVNEYRETVGLLSLEDVIEALLGRKIVDEFDAHDDLRAVAERNPRGNNRPQASEDV